MERTAGFRSEMAMGNSPVDGRTDLYGLGCVAYWLLTGTLVFEEKSATAMLLAHVQKLHLPSRREPISRCQPLWIAPS
jgi:serine/threonine-protein kinase